MPRKQQPEQHFPVRLTQAQRKVVAEIVPELADRLKLEERNQRTIPLTLAERKAIKAKTGAAGRKASTGKVRNSLRHVTDLTAQALDRSRGGAISAAERIWRRFRVNNCTLDKLHLALQVDARSQAMAPGVDCHAARKVTA